MPRIQRGRDAADAAALACGVGALEGQDQRTLAEVRVTYQFGKLSLPVGQLRFVFVLAELLREVECRQYVQSVIFERHRRRNRVILVTIIGQPLLQRIQHDAPDGQRAIAVVIAFNDDPRCPGGVGYTQHMRGFPL